MYRHAWTYQPAHPDYITAWPGIVEDTYRIVETVRQAGLVIAGPAGRYRPVLDTAHDILFNGDASTDLDAAPFHLLAPLNGGNRHHWILGGCATHAKPYDLAVAAVLLRVKLLLPEVINLFSTGAWTVEWTYGTGSALPWDLHGIGARRLLTGLFGPAPDTNPLQPIAPADRQE